MTIDPYKETDDKTYEELHAEKEKSYAAMRSDSENPIQKVDVLTKKLNVITNEFPPTDANKSEFEKLFGELKAINDKYPIYFDREYASTDDEIERVEEYALYLSYEEDLRAE